MDTKAQEELTTHEQPPPKPLIEVGWVLAGNLDAVDRDAARKARALMLSRLSEAFPVFEWRMPVLLRKELGLQERVEPVSLIDHGVVERDAQRWDFALVVTGADLKSYYKPFALGTPSQAVNVAVLSTAWIDPAATHSGADGNGRADGMTRRLLALALHLFGHLNDLPHSNDPGDVMYDLKTVEDLDRMEHFSDAALARLEGELHAEADLRLEETEHYRGKALLFYVRAAFQNRLDILNATFGIRPWEFPFRFSRLTTAAASTMLILVITAEAWDLGMSQPPLFVLAISLAALVGTCFFIVKRQRLLVRRRAQRLSEQRVVANTSVVLAVVVGMATVYGLLFATTLFLSQTLFSPHLIEGWAASLDGDIRPYHFFVLAGFVASLGIIIGALGASFEEESYFRHVAYIDEET